VSVEAVKWAMYEAPHLVMVKSGKPDTTARAVLGVLAEHADEYGGNAFCGPPRIRFATGYDERTIRRALERLEDGGLIAKDGVTHLGANRWKLALSVHRPDSDWTEIVAEGEAAKRAEAARVKAYRDRQSSVHREESTDAESVRTDAESVRTDFKSVCTDAVPPEPPEPPTNHQGTTSGGTLPPSPLRPEAPSGLRTDEANSLPADQDPPLDAVSNYRPHARENEANTAEIRSTQATSVETTPADTKPAAETPFLAAPQHQPAASDDQPRRQAHTAAREPCPHGKPRRTTRKGEPRCEYCRTGTEPPAEPDPADETMPPATVTTPGPVPTITAPGRFTRTKCAEHGLPVATCNLCRKGLPGRAAA